MSVDGGLGVTSDAAERHGGQPTAARWQEDRLHQRSGGGAADRVGGRSWRSNARLRDRPPGHSKAPSESREATLAAPCRRPPLPSIGLFLPCTSPLALDNTHPPSDDVEISGSLVVPWRTGPSGDPTTSYPELRARPVRMVQYAVGLDACNKGGDKGASRCPWTVPRLNAAYDGSAEWIILGSGTGPSRFSEDGSDIDRANDAVGDWELTRGATCGGDHRGYDETPTQPASMDGQCCDGCRREADGQMHCGGEPPSKGGGGCFLRNRRPVLPAAPAWRSACGLRVWELPPTPP